MRELRDVAGAVDPATPTTSDPPWWDELQTVPDMKRAALDAQQTDPKGSVVLAGALRTIKEQDTAMLLLRVSTVQDPLVAWALHVELDRRDVPPCLRPEMEPRSPQARFIATLADLRWLAHRHPEHRTNYQRHQGVFRYGVAENRWHSAVLWAYRQCRGERHSLAVRLGLTDEMRKFTMSLPSTAQQGDRKWFRTRRVEIESALVDHALARPDKSGRYTAEGIAARRMTMLSAFLTLDRDQTKVLRFLKTSAGIDITRQSLMRHLRAAAEAGDCERRVFRSL